jgi:hypothetical protein
MKRIGYMGSLVLAIFLLTEQARALCEGDINGDNRVAISELITAVNNALSGCEEPLSIVGLYEGQGFEVRAGCRDVGQNGTFEVSGISVDITQQEGSLYEGTLNLIQPGGEPLALALEGTVNDDGFTRGQGFLAGVPVPAAQFNGGLVGDTLVISVAIGNPLCESDAASFIGARN